MESIIASFSVYYGADWASMLFGFCGAWMITNKNKWGFALLIVSLFLAMATAVIAGQYGFIVANIINVGIAVRGFYKWTREAAAEKSAPF